ncbi:hypothetical protein [Streptomyces sp. NPDC056227]|uniref:hypothetical protein n=1 Tax=Streptomyces sp. NPDC056227 TaxID=3345753 RepID=UPI0035D7358E
MKRPRTRRPGRRTARSHYFSYLFLTLALVAAYSDQGEAALASVGLAALTWKGNRKR